MDGSSEHRRILEYVERWGVIFEQLGSSRMAGKILGWLMVADPPHQSASRIAEAIAASAASVSNGTRALLQMGMIERVGVRGERSYHYQVGRTWWNTLIDHKMRQVTAMKELADRGLELVAPRDRDSAARLREFAEYCSYLERELPELVREWERRKGAAA